MRNNKLNKYLFVLGSFLLVYYLAINTNTVESSKPSELEMSINEDNTQINQNDFSLTSENINDNLDEQSSTEMNLNNDNAFEIKKSIESNQINNQKSIFVNSIKIAQAVDRDKTSDTYREPINAFQTITTLDKNVTKEINYYPLLYVWSSINTENIALHQILDNAEDKEETIKPIELSMSIKCGDQVIKELNYQVSAKTPRWREWVEINLSELKEESLKNTWSVQIIDQENKEILESRNFMLKKNLSDNMIKQTAEIMND